MYKILMIAAVLLIAVSLWLSLDEDAARGLKKEAQLAALDAIGDAATERLGGGDESGATHGSAVELIKRIFFEQLDYHMAFAAIETNMLSMIGANGEFDIAVTAETIGRRNSDVPSTLKLRSQATSATYWIHFPVARVRV